MIGWRERSQKNLRRLTPAFIPAGEVHDRPVAPPQETAGPEHLKEMVDEGAEILDRPSGSGLRHQAGQLADDIASRGHGRHVGPPGIEAVLADQGFCAVVDNDREVLVMVGDDEKPAAPK